MLHIEGTRGILFDIQHMSFQDGPGIRTSLFFKGCPLRCKWCHNPESYLSTPQLMYQSNRCVGCGECVKACPNGAHYFQGGMHEIDRSRCTSCGKCIEVCCYGALNLSGKVYSVESLWREIESDRPYYGKRDLEGDCGGITLTGGEPMTQASFIREFLRDKQNTHVCMETSGYAKPEDYLKLIDLVDLFLFDYKATNPEKHKSLTGVDNALIISNLQMLLRAGARVILRLPMIPGVNDDDEHLRGIAGILCNNPEILRAEIMAYHRLGVGKVRQLGMGEPEIDLPNASFAQKKEWVKKLEGYGVKRVTIG